MFRKLNADCDRAIKWVQENGTEANPNKFHLMFLGTNGDNLSIYINGTKIKNCNEVKIIRCNNPYNKLAFLKHMASICNTVGKRIKALLKN